MGEIVYGRTKIGQMLYDFGFAKLTDKWLARKYAMRIVAVRDLKKRVRKNLKPLPRKRKRR